MPTGVLGCVVSKALIPYLGLKVGGRLGGVDGWQMVVEKVRKKLRAWEVRSISLGGRVMLVQSCLASIPLYWMSLLPLPKGVEGKLRSLQCRFLWGGDENMKKIAWMRWEEICRSKKEGGLGIKNLHLFNSTLLCKWIWRFFTETESLWVRVVRSRHGPPTWKRGSINEARGRSKPVGWWSKITTLVEGNENKWFWEKMVQKLGNGKEAPFWEGAWSGEKSLKELYPRLFLLNTNKKGKVQEMGSWQEGKWVWGLEWRRNLFDWEREKEQQLLLFLNNFPIIEDGTDRWLWEGKEEGVFSVRNVYKERERLASGSNYQRPAATSFGYIWKAMAIRKAKLMAWRLIWNRLPTKDNVCRRMMLSEEAIDCAVCGKARESALHVFLECEEGAKVWNFILSWSGMAWVAHNNIEDHLSSFVGLFSGKRWRKRMGGLWIYVVWVMWRWRNEVVFASKTWELGRVVEEIKCRFHSWCAINGEVDANLSFRNWSKIKLSELWNRDL